MPHLLGRSLTVLLLASATSALAAPVGVTEPGRMRLAGRDVRADPALPLPGAGAAFYLFTSRALRRDEVRRLEDAGVRYLGVADRHAYGFVNEGADADRWRALLSTWPHVLGAAEARPVDRARADVLAFLRRGGPEARLPYPLAVALWPKTPAGAARRVLPEAVEDLAWPADDAAPIGLELAGYLSAEASTVARLDKLLASPYVAAVGFLAPKASFNEASRTLSNSNQVFDAPYGLDGTGVLVGHWDGGRVDTDHPDLAGRVTNLDGDGVSNHATHTAGTVLGSGANNPDARGHAPGAEMLALTYRGNAPRERRQVKHLRYHEHDNHSWGQNPDTVDNFGTYNQTGFEFDLDARDLLLTAVKSAGNNGRESEVIVDNFGFDSLAPDSTGKNAVVVGATNDEGNLGVFSSRGPTEDGRIKPDVVAVGVQVLSCQPGGGYRRTNGTSMSAPGVTGITALLSQLYKRENQGRRWAPDMIRTVLIHTARDRWNEGPDYRYGWGLADTQRAADLITADRVNEGRNLVRGAVREGEVIEFPLEVPPGRDELKVTLTWLDAFMNPPAQRLLLNDIDLVLVSPSGEVEYPFSLDPDNPLELAVRAAPNTVDNVEQVHLQGGVEAGTWTVRVTGTSITDPDLFVQGFVLASDVPLERYVARFGATFEGESGTEIPDAGELAMTFDVPDVGTVTSLRLYLDIKHDARGDLRIILQSPDGERATIETEDQSGRLDIYAIYPDLRSYDDDTLVFTGKPSFGTWTVFVIDVRPDNVGEVRGATLELDTDGVLNTPPVAAATGTSPVTRDDPVALDATASSDPDGDALTFAWTQTEGPQVTLDGATTATTGFTAPDVAETTDLVFAVTVDDARGGVDRAEVRVTVEPPNAPPLADAGPDQTIAPEAKFALDGTASTDPDGDVLTFTWTQLDGPTVDIPDATEASPVVTAPAVTEPTILRFGLLVDDGRLTAEDQVQITIDPAEAPLEQLETEDGCSCRATAAPTPTATPWAALVVLSVALVTRRRRRS